MQQEKNTAIIAALIVVLCGFLFVTFKSSLHNVPASEKHLIPDTTNGGTIGFGKTPPPPQCNDHLDNDGDGYCDFKTSSTRCKDHSKPGDPDCTSKTDNKEAPDVCGDKTCDASENCATCSQDCGICPPVCGNSICEENETCSNCATDCGTCPVPLDPRCHALKYDSTPINHVNLVFVPSNFSGDMMLFQQHAQEAWNTFNRYVPYDPAIQKLNAFYVTDERGSYCNFNCSGIERLLCCSTAIAKSSSSICTTGSRQTVVIHNNEKYGGAGYTSEDVATTSTNIDASRVAVHETGHSLFNLGDEYNYPRSTPSSSPNCDYSTCTKWKEMFGWWGIGCNGARCGDNLYYIGENSIMYSLVYQFEEVNERISCCAYYQETKTFPHYCDKFQGFVPNLYQLCQVIPSNLTGPAPQQGQQSVEKPFEYTFAKDDAGNWNRISVVVRNQGTYPQQKVSGEGKGTISIKTVKKNGKTQEFLFDEQVPVEYPLDAVKMGGYAQQPRKTVSIIVDQADSYVSSITVNDKRVFG